MAKVQLLKPFDMTSFPPLTAPAPGTMTGALKFFAPAGSAIESAKLYGNGLSLRSVTLDGVPGYEATGEVTSIHSRDASGGVMDISGLSFSAEILEGPLTLGRGLFDLAEIALAKSDVVTGSSGSDVIDGRAGDDRLIGGAGNDVFADSRGRNVVDGGSGYDVVSLSSGLASARFDLALTGMQTLGGSNGLSVTGVEGARVSGGASWTLLGTAGANGISGGSSADVISGRAGNDALSGGGGSDLISGGIGDDRIVGGAGNDVLRGDAGRDAFVFSDAIGTDRVSGGADADTFVFSGSASGRVTIDTLSGGGKTDLIDLSGVAGSHMSSVMDVVAHDGRAGSVTAERTADRRGWVLELDEDGDRVTDLTIVIANEKNVFDDIVW